MNYGRRVASAIAALTFGVPSIASAATVLYEFSGSLSPTGLVSSAAANVVRQEMGFGSDPIQYRVKIWVQDAAYYSDAYGSNYKMDALELNLGEYTFGLGDLYNSPGYVSVYDNGGSTMAYNTYLNLRGNYSPSNYGTEVISFLFQGRTGNFARDLPTQSIDGLVASMNLTYLSPKTNYVAWYTDASPTVSITPPIGAAVPEPATWAMMIIGFGAVGSTVRTSRRRNVLLAA